MVDLARSSRSIARRLSVFWDRRDCCQALELALRRPYIRYLKAMIRILVILQQAFSLWMLVDAIRRGCRSYWYLVVLMPFGEWVYFFVVKIHDPEFDWVRLTFRRLTTPKTSLDALRQRVKRTPTWEANLTLAEALFDNEQYREAQDHYSAARRLDDADPDALRGIARCQIARGDYAAGIENLNILIDTDPSYGDYIAWKDAAYALRQADRSDEAHALLDRLVTTSPRLEHRALYAHYLMHADRPGTAMEQLELGLFEYGEAPKYLQRKDRAWARQARRMLKAIPAQAVG